MLGTVIALGSVRRNADCSYLSTNGPIIGSFPLLTEQPPDGFGQLEPEPAAQQFQLIVS